MTYAELQVTTCMSFMQASSHPDELLSRAREIGLKSMAITDRNSLAGIVRGHVMAQKLEVKVIPACRLDLEDGPSLLAYPTDKDAYAGLSALLTLGNLRTEKGKCLIRRQDVYEHAAGIGVSLTFLKDEAGPNPEYLGLLVASWVLFVFAIVIVIVSIHMSQKGISQELENIAAYYLGDDDDAFTRGERLRKATRWLNTSAGLLFIAALVVTLAFFSFSILGKEMKMEEPKITSVRPHTGDELRNGADVPQMVRKGAEWAPMQAKPAKPVPTNEQVTQPTKAKE